MKDKTLKIVIIGTISLMLLSGFSPLLVESAKSIKVDDDSSFFATPKSSSDDMTCSEHLNMLMDDTSPLIMNDIFLDKNSFAIDDAERPEFVPGEFIVKFKSDIHVGISTFVDDVPKISVSSVDALNKKHDVTAVQTVFDNKKKLTVDSLDLSNVYKFILSEDIDILSVVEEYSKDPHVVYAEPNYIYHTCDAPNDPYFYEQWALNQSNDHDIDAPEAWDIEIGNSDVTIAIVDTGVDYTHPDLAANIWINDDEIPDNDIDDDGNGFIDDVMGWDFVNNDSDPMDDHGHGTHCAGIAGAVGNNSVGIAGVCWSCTIMPVKSFSIWGITNLANGITYAADNGADVISMSWGGGYSSSLIEEAINYAYSKGVVLVAAAGNSNTDRKLYPAGYDEVIAVAATDSDDEKAWFSSYGDWIDVAAPGVDVLSLRANGTDMYGDGTHIVDEDYYTASGTSMACPHVAGLAALILSRNQSLGQDMVRTIINYSVDGLDPNDFLGRGRINAYDALQRGTGSAVAILDPSIHGTDVKEIIDINGTAQGGSFQYYVIEYSKGRYPNSNSWTETTNSTLPIQDDVLGSLNTTELDEGLYTIRLRLICIDGTYKDTIWIMVNNEYNTLIVDDDGGPGVDYISIQEAVYNSGNGDTVYVRRGIYYENVKIQKSINLTGEDEENVIIESDRYRFIIYISGYGVNISGFTIKNNFSSYFFPYDLYDVSGIGIYLESADNSSIYRNIIKNEINTSGVRLDDSCNNSLNGNIIEINNNSTGVYLSNSSNNTISENTISYTTEELSFVNGILLMFSSTYNIISENTITITNGIGINLIGSSDNLLRNNEMIGCGLMVGSGNLSHFSNDIDTSNTVNGKTLYYYLNEMDISVPSDAGQVILANCSNCTVCNLILNNCTVGIELAFSDINNICNNTISNNLFGIVLSLSNRNSIYVNNITNNYYGVTLGDYSSNNSISENIVENNKQGISLIYSSNNTITANTITNNKQIGISYLHWSSGDNIIYHNNFINNTQNAYDLGTDIWDDGYPSGGNYWDDYNGTDADGDGIGDTSYDIPGSIFGRDNQDRYPLVYPFGDNAPTAIFEYEINDLMTIFNSSSSLDRDGVICSWHWDFGDGNTSDKQNPQHNYTNEGYYNVSLNVTDNDGYSSMVTKEIFVGNFPPVANFTYTAYGLTVTFNASSSYDIGGTIVNYTWAFGDGTNATSVESIITHTYDKDYITYNVTLTVTDNAGDSASFSKNVTINDTTKPTVKIEKPERAIYIDNEKKINRLFCMAFIVGDITIEVNASDGENGSGVEKVEFILNGKVVNTSYEPNDDGIYTYQWTKDRVRLFHIYTLKAKTYDKEGNTKTTKPMIVRKIL